MKQIVALTLILLVGCDTPEQKERWKVAAVVAGVAAVVYAASRGGGGGSGYQAPTNDYDWEWDQYYENYQLRWSCRGVQSGQFAEDSKCAYKAKNDWKWPNK